MGSLRVGLDGYTEAQRWIFPTKERFSGGNKAGAGGVGYGLELADHPARAGL